MQHLIDKANILIEALPYIQKFKGKTLVVKYGGNAMINEELKDKVMEDVTLLKFIGLNPIIVHGGGPDITAALDKFGIKTEFINGLRVTDAQTMEVAQMVLTGKTNKEIVSRLNTKGGSGIGISGIDGNLIQCEKHIEKVDGKDVDIGYVGKIVKINPQVLKHLTDDDYIPVIAPVGVDSDGNSYNVNADIVAGEIAAALQAEKLILLTDIEGIQINGETVYYINEQEIREHIESGAISGGMIPKVQGCINALNNGVNSVHIIDGRIPHCILLEIFTKTGIGTMISK
jgi:acetylglutamate kinase